MADHRTMRSGTRQRWSALLPTWWARHHLLTTVLAVVLTVPVAVMGFDSAPTAVGGDAARQPTVDRVIPARTTTTVQRPRVALVGDSPLRGAEDHIRGALDEAEIVAFDGRNGHSIGEQLYSAVEMADQEPDVLVVVLGVNDAGPNFEREAMETEVRRFLDAVSHTRCIRWVTAQEDLYVDGLFTSRAGTLTLNVTLFREAERRPNLEVVDFAPVINDRPDWHIMDLLHLNDQGNEALAGVIAESLDCVE